MHVSLKTLQDDIFTVEIEPSETVKCFKEKIEKEKGEKFPAKNMKLMYAGKFLVDNKKVSDYNVEEKKFVIIVIKKPKVTAAKEAEAEPESSSEVEETSDTRRDQRTPDEALIDLIVELGFPRSEVTAALLASFNNPDRAVEYLINGAFPSSSNEDAETEARRQDPDYTSDAAAVHLLRELGNAAGVSSGNMPSRDRIMEIFSEAMDESNNDLRTVENELDRDRDLVQRAFEEVTAADRANSGSEGTAANLSGIVFNEIPEIPAEIPGRYPTIDPSFFSSSVLSGGNASPLAGIGDVNGLGFAGNLMDRDHDAIERLKQLGFSDQRAIEAYFVCERNENAAADYLFSHNFD